MTLSSRPIVVVGSINMDLVATSSRVPGPGETLAGIEFKSYPGGKGANQSVAIARLGYPVKLIGKVGDDSFGVELKQGLKEAGVDITGVETVSGSSGVAIINVSLSGDNSIVVVPGANGLLTPEDLDQRLEVICGAGIVLTQLEVPMRTVEHLAVICEREGVPLMLDPAPAQSLSRKLLAAVTWLTPNETEASFYVKHLDEEGDATGVESRTIEILLQAGVAGVILKQGAAGSRIADQKGLDSHIPAISVQAVDSTGAGDAYNGGFATGLMLGKDPVQSAQFAAAVAAVSVTRHGAQPSMPSLHEATVLLEAQKKAPEVDLKSFKSAR